jgi:hypothetical protein
MRSLHSVAVALVLVLVLLILKLTSAQPQGAPEIVVVLAVESDKIEAGQKPVFHVQLVNRSDKAIYLVGSLDASDARRHGRFHCRFLSLHAFTSPPVRPTAGSAPSRDPPPRRAATW